MAVSDVIAQKVGRELLEWVYLGIRTGARTACQEYHVLITAGRTAEAILTIKRAVDLPHRARARINLAITNYGLPAITAAIVAGNPNVTIGQVDAALTTLENYAQGLVNHVNNDAWTWNQVVADIEANVEQEQTRWVFPLPAGYLDVWGQ